MALWVAVRAASVGSVVALIMGVWLVGVNLAVEVLDPLRGLSAGLSALAAAVVGMLGCLLFFRRHITGGLVLMTAAVCEAAFVQPPFAAPLLGFGNYFTAGFSLDSSAIGFRSTSTLARLSPSLLVAVDPALAGSGSIIHANGDIGYAPVSLRAATTYYGLYAMDALDLTDALTVTVGRANDQELGAFTVDYGTSDETAKAGQHYTATRGTLTFAQGEQTKTLRVPILYREQADRTRKIKLWQ